VQYDRSGFVSAEDGTRLFWGVRGSGPPLVLCDGIGCDGFIWRYLQPELARSHTVVHWHYRGHGRSGLPSDPDALDISTLARDLHAVLEPLRLGPVVVLGHSMGTQVALEHYRLYPASTRALVLVCGTYGRLTDTFHGTDVLKNVLPGIIDAMQRRTGLARALWGRVPSGLAFRVARLSGEVDRLSIREEDFRTYWDHVNLMAPTIFLPMLRLAGEHTAEDLLPQIAVPALVIAAERDTFTPFATARTMSEQIPDAEFLLLSSASHAAPVEQPQAVLNRIDRFFRERLGETDPSPLEEATSTRT
jgi:pimeloyl-ACP methyl ester carboxylesterase